jgi:hypothetical protein
MALTHTKKVKVGPFIKAKIRIRPKRSGSDRIRTRNTVFSTMNGFGIICAVNGYYEKQLLLVQKLLYLCLGGEADMRQERPELGAIQLTGS